MYFTLAVFPPILRKFRNSFFPEKLRPTATVRDTSEHLMLDVLPFSIVTRKIQNCSVA